MLVELTLCLCEILTHVRFICEHFGMIVLKVFSTVFYCMTHVRAVESFSM